ncbi:MAG: FAD-dependent oxidoreductase [Desulfotalea sp.]
MGKFEYDIGVIGGGAAGLTVASGSSQLGAKTILIEQEDKLGGDCLHYGCVPSKTLIHSASTYHSMAHTEELGLPAMSRDPVDFSQISNRINKVVETIQVHDSVERFNNLGIKVVFGKASFIDPHTVIVGENEITSKKWVIASGSSPIIPNFTGSEFCLTNRDIFSLDLLPKHLVILGAGPIGIEMAQAFARLGSKVTVVQRSDQILSREDKDLADLVMQALINEKVEFCLEHTILSVVKKTDQLHVSIIDHEKNQKQLVCSHVLIALGRKPNIDQLFLENAGVKYNKNGVTVDSRLRTNVKHIYAAGDITGKYQFTHAAGYEGGVVITNAIMGLPRKTNYKWMPRCTFSDPEFAVIGKSEKELKLEGIDYSIWSEDFKDNDRAVTEAAIAGKIKLLLSNKGKLLGVHIVGSSAGDLLGEWVAIVNGNMKLSQLAGAVHPYPTKVEINKRVVGKYFGEKIFSDKVRKILALIHRYQGRAI